MSSLTIPLPVAGWQVMWPSDQNCLQHTGFLGAVCLCYLAVHLILVSGQLVVMGKM
jgi:hypothetical protein